MIMTAKILILDDIYSDIFRNKLQKDQLAWDDNWAASIEQALTSQDSIEGSEFNVVKSGEIDSVSDIMQKEKPDAVILDLFWPENANQNFGDRSRGMDISMEALKIIREKDKKIPVICHTVKPNKETLDTAYENGATFFLEKISVAIPEVQKHLKYIIMNLLRNDT